MKPQINTDEHGAAQPQPKLWSTVLFGVRQLAAAFLRVEFVPSPSRRKQAGALQRRTQECWSFAKSFSAASASQRTTPMILSRRQFSKTLFAAPFVLRAQQEPLRAHVKIDTERVIGDIDPKIYGNFIEHLGRCIDGGVFEEGSPLADANGFRRDVLDAAKKLNVTILRWPGGNFSSNYHWKDGIGPRDARPPRLEMAWGTVESNRFGTLGSRQLAELWGQDPSFFGIFARGWGAELRHGVRSGNLPKTQPMPGDGKRTARHGP